MKLYRTPLHSQVYELYFFYDFDISDELTSDIASVLNVSVGQVQTVLRELSEDGLIMSDSKTDKKDTKKGTDKHGH